MSINNIHQLREFVSDQLEKLCSGDIKAEDANACAMLSANMLLSIRLEMEYSKLRQEIPHIRFMEKPDGNLIEGKVMERLPKK